MKKRFYMRHITLKWTRLFRYCLLFICASLLITALSMLILTKDWRTIFNLKIQIQGIELAFIAVIYISFPFLIARFFYYFYQLITHGRKEGISLFCYQTLFNPFNFIFRPSLLTTAGLTTRRRCIIALILMACLYGSIFAISQMTT